jgi:hypothetical protein
MLGAAKGLYGVELSFTSVDGDLGSSDGDFLCPFEAMKLLIAVADLPLL